MRFLLSALISTLAMVGASASSSSSSSSSMDEFLSLSKSTLSFVSESGESQSRLLGPKSLAAAHAQHNDFHVADATASAATASTAAPTTPAPYAFTTTNMLGINFPYPPHQARPLPTSEVFSVPQLWGAQAYAGLATTPWGEARKRNPFSRPYNSTIFTSLSQFPKHGAAFLTSIDPLSDEYFGWIRFVGLNAQQIKRISSVSSKFGPGVSALQSKYPQFNTWLSNGQVFELDYASLATIPNTPLAASYDGSTPAQPRYLPAPYVLLAYVQETTLNWNLVPIAIQIDQTYVAGTTAVLYRADYKDSRGATLPNVNVWEWNYAKTVVNAADTAMVTYKKHLVQAHFIMGNIITGVHAALPTSHPVYSLIVGEGHGYKTLQVNDDGYASLVPGYFDDIFAGGFVGSMIFINELFASYNYTQDYVPADLTARGFGEFVGASSNNVSPLIQSVSPFYFYASDAVASWGIIRSYVNDVLHSVYPTDASVRADSRLQSLAQLLSTPTTSTSTAPVPGFPSSFTDFTTLVDAVTAAIFKSTVGHSAVNYPLLYFNLWQPLSPFTLFNVSPLTQTLVQSHTINEEYIAKALGNANNLEIYNTLAFALGQAIGSNGLPDDISLLQYATNALAAYSTTPPPNPTPNPANYQATKRLYSALTGLSQTIQARNAALGVASKPHLQYPWLDPALVANAIVA